MKIRFLLFILIIAVHCSIEAQDSIDLIINIDGELYRWSENDSEPIRTNCDLQGNTMLRWKKSLTLSSTGEWAAFMVLPSDAEMGAPSPTGNLWLCNLGSGEAYALSNQRYETPGLVSEGVFSPNGESIIWTEIVDYDSASVTMFIHDLALGETRVLVESLGLDSDCGVGPRSPKVIWGRHGIAIAYVLLDDNVCDGYEDYGLSYYAEDGRLINSFLVSRQEIGNYQWLDTDEPRIAYLSASETIPEPEVFSINMLTGDVRSENGTLEAFIAGADSAMVSSLADSGFSQIKLPNTDSVLETVWEMDAAFAPDGESMAIIIGRMLYFASNGNLEQASWNQKYYPVINEVSPPNFTPANYGQFELAWAQPNYRLVSKLGTQCPSVEHLALSATLYVVEGLGENNVREAPLASAELLGSLEESAFVPLTPDWEFYRPRVEICSGGIRWREIIFDNRLAWTAESQGNTYYLESR